MKSSTTADFHKRLNQLPISVREQANKAYALWKTDSYHSSLQFKRVSQRQPIYSVRISLNYRALGLLEEDHTAVCRFIEHNSNSERTNFVDG